MQPTRINRTLFTLISLTLCVASGCNELESDPYRMIPAPISKKFPYELSATTRISLWTADCIEVREGGILHFLVLQGVDSPKSGQEHFRETAIFLRKKIRDQSIRIVVYGTDEHKREIGRAYAGDVDINYEMVRAGMAWYDGVEFEDATKFKQAELDARKARLGLWKAPFPVHPAEFEKQRPNGISR